MTMADTMVEVHNPAGTAAVKCKTSEIPDGWLRSWDNTIAGKKAALEAPQIPETEAEELARMKAELKDLEDEAEEETIKVDGHATSEDEDDDEDGMKALQKEIEDEEAAKAASEDSVDSDR